MRTADFDFSLPEALIALRPAERRDGSRLLHVGERVADRRFTDLPDLLREGDLLVLNDTRVLAAALRGVRSARAIGGGGDVAVDVNLLQRLDGEDTWRALVRPAKRLREGDLIDFGHSRVTGGLVGLVLRREGGEVDLRLSSTEPLAETLRKAGFMPLPPYIARRRPADDEDRDRYQTVYAREEGSVAAPTAGLHFTEGVFAALEAKGVGRTTLTLHVGAGTFLPVSSEDTDEHEMHAEWGRVTEGAAAAIREAKARGGRIVCVGTTSLRLLETAAASGEVCAFTGETDLFITPGFEFQAADLLLTNFHLPRSTLFMLVCAFAGTERMRAAYAHAVEAGYRFYSYGDACLLERGA
jgi:S-adenosylmethionine:tRNA ribosyltransferase-isomerase